MKKHLLSGLVVFAAAFGAFAGDAAAFVDMGLSSDGRTYVFGEYGRTDGDFQGYAEIYAVDIAKNNWISGEVFTVKPSAQTASKSGKSVFDELKVSAEWKLNKYNLKPVAAENLLYVKDINKSADSEIVFKDFEGSTEDNPVFFHINLVKTVEGKGVNCRSSFYINLEKTDDKGNTIARYKVGTPDLKRKAVTGYQITRIFSDKSKKNIVFVVEKTVADKKGSSIRYMVETVALSDTSDAK